MGGRIRRKATAIHRNELKFGPVKLDRVASGGASVDKAKPSGLAGKLDRGYVCFHAVNGFSGTCITAVVGTDAID